MKDLELILNPTLEDFAKFSAYTGGPILRDGYYGFISDDIFLARCEGYIVGYLTYRRSEVYVELQSIFVAPEFRRRGIATFLVEQALKYFMERGVCVAEIEAVTPEGRAHARSLKFHKLEWWCNWNQEHTRYIKILCPYRKSTKNAKNLLRIWHREFYKTKIDDVPSMSWALGNSKLPIIFWCNSAEWRVQIIEDRRVIQDGCVKDVLGTTSKYIRLETEGTKILPWVPECMKGTQYTHKW